MNGIHEVRGSIPLVSTNNINNLGHRLRCPFLFLIKIASSVRDLSQVLLRRALHGDVTILAERIRKERREADRASGN